jgi:uncharacterized protein (DUF2384 family)
MTTEAKLRSPAAPRTRRPARTTPRVGSAQRLLAYLDANGLVRIEETASTLRMSKAQLAETAGLDRAVLQKASRRDSPKAQSRLREMLEILQRVQDWAGSAGQAMAWYRAEPIPALGGRTAESLVQSGDAKAVRDYLDHVARGGYA